MDQPTEEIAVLGFADPGARPKPRRKGPVIAMVAAAVAVVGGGVTGVVLLQGDDEPPSSALPVARTTAPVVAVAGPVPPAGGSPSDATTIATTAPTSTSTRKSTTTTTRPAATTTTPAAVDEVAALNQAADRFVAAIMTADGPTAKALVCDPGRVGTLTKPGPGEGVKRSGSAKVTGTTGSVPLTITAEGRTATESFNARKQNGKWCLTMR